MGHQNSGLLILYPTYSNQVVYMTEQKLADFRKPIVPWRLVYCVLWWSADSDI